MIKVSVVYPRTPDTHFDMDYYITKHMPLCVKLLSKGLRKTEADAGLQSTVPGEPTAFYGGCQFYYESIAAFAEVWEKSAAEIVADIPKYTNTTPVIQFNELKFTA